MRIRLKFPNQVPFSVRTKETVLFLDILMTGVKHSPTSFTIDIETNEDPRIIEAQVWDLPEGDKIIAAAKHNLKTAFGTEHELRIKNKTSGKIVECKRFEAIPAS